MKENKTVLFFGNGLNRVYDDQIEWGALLKSLATEFKVDFDESIPFTMEFERLVNQMYESHPMPFDEKNNYYDLLKSKISKKVISTDHKTKPLYLDFLKLPFDHIFTTNYDYNLENHYQELTGVVEGEYKTTETKYSIYRYREFDEKRFYHIHGEARYPKSLCLGYEHYANYLSKIMSLKSKWFIDEKDKKMFDSKLFEEKNHDDWVSYFLTHDIHIIGLGLTQNEMDIWWVLVYRAYLYYSNYCGARDIINNKIVYYYLDDQSDSKQKNFSYTILDNMNVEIVKIKSNNYIKFYEKVRNSFVKAKK